MAKATHKKTCTEKLYCVFFYEFLKKSYKFEYFEIKNRFPAQMLNYYPISFVNKLTICKQFLMSEFENTFS